MPDVQVKRSALEALERRIAELQDAVAARDAFLAVAAHELRNPMTPILAQTQRLKRVAETGSGSGRELAVGLGRLEQLIEHYIRRATVLLDVSRMTVGKLSLTPESFDLAALVREMAEIMKPAARHVGSSMTIDAPDRLQVRLDRLAVEQILDNLVSNAVKYGRGRPIHLRLRPEPDGAVVEVRDQGIGISPSDQSRIFGRFERAVNSGSTAGGFGVGLWVVGQLAEAMGARIEVRSTPGEGTTFVLRLPRHGTEPEGPTR